MVVSSQPLMTVPSLYIQYIPLPWCDRAQWRQSKKNPSALANDEDAESGPLWRVWDTRKKNGRDLPLLPVGHLTIFKYLTTSLPYQGLPWFNQKTCFLEPGFTTHRFKEGQPMLHWVKIVWFHLWFWTVKHMTEKCSNHPKWQTALTPRDQIHQSGPAFGPGH